MAVVPLGPRMGLPRMTVASRLSEWATRFRKAPAIAKGIDDMAHHANQLFAQIYPVIPEGCYYFNVYVRALPALKDGKPRQEILAAFHGDDSLTAEVALETSQRWADEGVCFGREMISGRRMGWMVMDAFNLMTSE